jgi:hypothetical protein
MMSITLTKEQTEIFRKRTRKMLLLFYIISGIVIMMATLLTMVTDVVYADALLIAYIGGVVGTIITLASMPRIKYYQEEPIDVND